MGKGMKRKRENYKRPTNGEAVDKQWHRDDRNSAPLVWNESRMTTDAFLKYYAEQKLVPEGQWEELFNTLMTGLPTTFW